MIEFTVKNIAFGFYFTPNAYLMGGWNRLDFVVVVFATVGKCQELAGAGSSPLGSILRLGRCLRPLRLINKNPGLKVIVNAIIDSMATNSAVLGLSFLLFLIFGILGCNVFGGKFYSCMCDGTVDGPITGGDAWLNILSSKNTTFAEMEESCREFPEFDEKNTEILRQAGEVLCESLNIPIGRALRNESTLPAYPYVMPDTKQVDFERMNDRVLCEANAGCEVQDPDHLCTSTV